MSQPPPSLFGILQAAKRGDLQAGVAQTPHCSLRAWHRSLLLPCQLCLWVTPPRGDPDKGSSHPASARSRHTPAEPCLDSALICMQYGQSCSESDRIHFSEENKQQPANSTHLPVRARLGQAGCWELWLHMGSTLLSSGIIFRARYGNNKAVTVAAVISASSQSCQSAPAAA